MTRYCSGETRWRSPIPAWFRQSALLLTIVAGATAPAANAQQPIVLAAHLLRFWDETGSAVAVLPFAVLAHAPMETSLPPTVVALTLRQRGEGSEVRDTSWLQPVDSVREPRGALASGFVVVALAPWISSWQLLAGDPPSAAAPADTMLPTRALPAGAIMLSDLAFGVAGHEPAWQVGTQRVRLDPLNSFTRQAPVHLTYQVWSAAARANVTTVIVCTDISNPKLGKRVLYISSPGRIGAGVNLVERDLEISHLKAGRYQVEVNVADRDVGAAWQIGAFSVH